LGSFSKVKSGWNPRLWTIDEAVRIYLLSILPIGNEGAYLKLIKDLFKTADAGELKCLYLALPFLRYPEQWADKTAEGIRSNIKEVFEAIALHNPYPSEYLSDNAWNQMVLKTIFTGSSLSKIYNFDKRVNEELTRMLIDFAHERWAAGREVNPELWRGVAPFANEFITPEIKRLFESDNLLEKEAAALLCNTSQVDAQREMLEQRPLLKSEITAGQLTWAKLGLSSKSN
jgi:hypothetical protein